MLADPDKDALLGSPPNGEEYATMMPTPTTRVSLRPRRRRKMRRRWTACLVLFGFIIVIVMMLAGSYLARVYLATNQTLEPMDPRCKLPLDAGDGDATNTSWGWDTKEARCRSFTYNGHGGNENRFPGEDSCIKACLTRVLV